MLEALDIDFDERKKAECSDGVVQRSQFYLFASRLPILRESIAANCCIDPTLRQRRDGVAAILASSVTFCSSSLFYSV
jgi:hypothetical protein